jgi:hypothetical protein
MKAPRLATKLPRSKLQRVKRGELNCEAAARPYRRAARRSKLQCEYTRRSRLLSPNAQGLATLCFSIA